MNYRPLTNVQKKTLLYILSFPHVTYREMAKHFKITPKAIHDRVVALQKKGYVKTSRNARSIQIIKNVQPGELK